jgi:hypothetical protein
MRPVFLYQKTKILCPRPCGVERGQTFLHQRDPFFVAPLLGHRTTALDGRLRQPEGKTVLGRGSDQALLNLLSLSCVSPKL